MLLTFAKGGIHPDENKLTSLKKTEVLPAPALVSIPVSQHLGAPATILVEKNSKVKIGQLIASGNGFVSANIHASVSGTVQKIDEIIDSSGYKRKAIIIKTEGDEWMDGIDTSITLIKDITLTPDEIVRKITDAGIVGLGGATFPSHVKLKVPIGKKADILLINGVECEPYLTSDHRVMLEYTHELLVGIQLLMRALQVEKAIIGIENNKPDAIALLQKESKLYSGILVKALKVKYPQGGEKQLIKALIKREVPSGGLPIDVGTVVHNVGTALAVYFAVQKNKPLIERVVTITGKSLTKPGNYWVRFGTSVTVLVEAAGGLPNDTGKIINGGPMMGKSIGLLDVPITKGTSGIVIIPRTQAQREPVQPCIRCAQCVTVCPMGLEPYLLMNLAEHKFWERSENEQIMDCIECGSCSFTCPSARPLLDYIRLGKSETLKRIRARKTV